MLITKLNEAKILQTDLDWRNCIDEDTSNWITVAYDLEIDKRRWYEFCTEVVEIDGMYMGVRHVSQMYSESGQVIDCYFTLQFKEMKPVTTITYV